MNIGITMMIFAEFFSYRLTVLAGKCYDCSSINHKGCDEVYSGSGFIRECARSQLDPEQKRCVKMHRLRKDAPALVVRSCVKEGTVAASMEWTDGCRWDQDVLTCVCSGYLCNASQPSRLQPSWVRLFGTCLVAGFLVIKTRLC